MKKHKNSESTTHFFLILTYKGSRTSEENQIKMRCLWLEYLLLLCVKSNSNRKKKCETCRHCRKKKFSQKIITLFYVATICCLLSHKQTARK